MGEKKGYILQKDAESTVFKYEPKQFPQSVKDTAGDFLSSQGKVSSDFIVSDLVSQQSGIADLARLKIEEQVEEQALEKLKQIEERAYKEAYELGLIEGMDKAFKDHKEELVLRLERLDDLLVAFENIKVDLVSKNELQILQLINLMASKVAMRHIEANRDVVLSVIKNVIEIAQSQEDVTIQVSLDDQMFLDNLREKSGKSVEFLRRVRIEPNDSVASGGCILETKYGAIDARIEQRFQKVWEAIERKMPRISQELFSDEAREPSEDEDEIVENHFARKENQSQQEKEASKAQKASEGQRAPEDQKLSGDQEATKDQAMSAAEKTSEVQRATVDEEASEDQGVRDIKSAPVKTKVEAGQEKQAVEEEKSDKTAVDESKKSDDGESA